MVRRLLERAGVGLGFALAPVTATISTLRRARMFHPRGQCYIARVENAGVEEPWSAIGERLEGFALVRFSGALWKHLERPDVLGCAIRFTDTDDPTTEPLPDDQDLLLATILRPWTMGVSPFTTRATDYLANRYNAVSPFSTPEASRTEWRLRPMQRSPRGNTRDGRLREAVRRDEASLLLEATIYRSPVALVLGRRFHPVAKIDLLRPATIDDAELAFDPFRSGRGIEPRGFIHALRVGTYAASQRARMGAGVSRARRTVDGMIRRARRGTPEAPRPARP